MWREGGETATNDPDDDETQDNVTEDGAPGPDFWTSGLPPRPEDERRSTRAWCLVRTEDEQKWLIT
jgi:hypothetical protein